MTPERFADCVKLKRFTSLNNDIEVVCAMYKRIFPTLAKHEEFTFCSWGDEEADAFLETLDWLTALKIVIIINSEMSADLKSELKTALEQRGVRYKAYASPDIAEGPLSRS